VSRSADEDNFEKMKAAYEACLNENAIKELGTAPLMEILHQVEDIFPPTTSNEISIYDTNAIKEAILVLADNGVSALIAAGTGPDDKSPDTVIVAVSPPWRIGLPSKERYEDDKLVKKYADVVNEVLSALYPAFDTQSASDVVDFEYKLAAASPDQQEREDITVSSPSPLSARHLTEFLESVQSVHTGRCGCAYATD